MNEPAAYARVAFRRFLAALSPSPLPVLGGLFSSSCFPVRFLDFFLFCALRRKCVFQGSVFVSRIRKIFGVGFPAAALSKQEVRALPLCGSFELVWVCFASALGNIIKAAFPERRIGDEGLRERGKAAEEVRC